MGRTMVRLIDFENNRRNNLCQILGFCGTLSFAVLGSACGENTERVISQIPVTYINANGGGSGGANTGGNSAASGGIFTGGTTSTGGSSSGSSSGGITSVAGSTNTLPPMSAVGSPIGYAAMGGNPTTGGGTRPPDYVSTCDDLANALQDASQSRVVVIRDNQTVNCHIVPANTVYVCDVQCDSSKTGASNYIHRYVSNTPTSCGGSSSADAGTSAIADTADARTINVASNKTLLGLGSGSTISGATLYLKGQTNVIIQNLNLQDVNPSMIEAGDTITIDGSDHVWVDHCTFQMVSDGFVDGINSSNAITISWNHFNGINQYACGGQHNFADTLQDALVTFHHNFYDHTLGCSPKASKKSSDTRMHIFNNYWLNVMYYSIEVGNGAEAYIEGNYFNNSNRPYWSVSSCVDDGSCTIQAPVPETNLFEGISADSAENKDIGGTLVDLPPYSNYSLEDAGVIPVEVDAGAGPTLTIL